MILTSSTSSSSRDTATASFLDLSSFTLPSGLCESPMLMEMVRGEASILPFRLSREPIKGAEAKASALPLFTSELSLLSSLVRLKLSADFTNPPFTMSLLMLLTELLLDGVAHDGVETGALFTHFSEQPATEDPLEGSAFTKKDFADLAVAEEG